jgi:hypothetical protein
LSATRKYRKLLASSGDVGVPAIAIPFKRHLRKAWSERVRNTPQKKTTPSFLAWACAEKICRHRDTANKVYHELLASGVMILNAARAAGAAHALSSRDPVSHAPSPTQPDARSCCRVTCLLLPDVEVSRWHAVAKQPKTTRTGTHGEHSASMQPRGGRCSCRRCWLLGEHRTKVHEAAFASSSRRRLNCASSSAGDSALSLAPGVRDTNLPLK